MTQLIFEPEFYPRTMTRAEWLRAYRWVRKTKRELASQQERIVAVALLSGDDRLRKEVCDKLIYPPLLVVPDINLPYDIDLSPGAISYVRKPRKGFLP